MDASKVEKRCGGDLEVEDDDRKMEEFFDLIRSFREAQNRRKEELREMEETKMGKAKKMKRSGEEEQSRWIPTFRREDFAEQIEFRRPPMIFPTPCNNKDKRKQREDELDLNLKL